MTIQFKEIYETLGKHKFDDLSSFQMSEYKRMFNAESKSTESLKVLLDDLNQLR